MTEIEFIEAALQQYREALGKLPEKFKASQREADRKEAHLCEEAGIMGEVQAVRDSLNTAQKQIQSQADVLQGRIGVLEEIHNQFYLAPIPEGVTHMYGIELAPLDPTTRLMVMHGQEADTWQDTILSLEGDPDDPREGYEEEDEEEYEEDEEYEDPEPHFLPESRIAAALTAPHEVHPDPSPVEEMLSERWGSVLDEEGLEDPKDDDLDEIELSEIETRIDKGEATEEDVARAHMMLQRAHSDGA